MGAILNEMGAFGASLEGILGGEGGHAAAGDDTEIEAFVTEDVSLSRPKLQAYAEGKWRISARALEDPRLQMSLNIYLMPTDGTAVRLSLDGRKIGKVRPGEHLTLLPRKARHHCQ